MDFVLFVGLLQLKPLDSSKGHAKMILTKAVSFGCSLFLFIRLSHFEIPEFSFLAETELSFSFFILMSNFFEF